jgi:hypothetical protein
MKQNDSKQMIHLVGQEVVVKHVDGSEIRGILQKTTVQGIYIIPIQDMHRTSD